MQKQIDTDVINEVLDTNLERSIRTGEKHAKYETRGNEVTKENEPKRKTHTKKKGKKKEAPSGKELERHNSKSKTKKVICFNLPIY